MPRISIVVPVYHVEQYLPCCIDSILGQSFTDFELILVDDGSPDNCGAICDAYAEKDPRVRVIHQKNSGVSVARNRGVHHAVGEYVTFIDSDDWVDSRFLACLYAPVKEVNADVGVSGVCYVGSQDDIQPIVTSKYRKYDKRAAIEHYGQINDTASFRGPVVKLLRREIVASIPFPENRHYAEDFAVVYKWYDAASVIVGMEDQLYFYRKTENSATQRPFDLRRLGNLDTLEELLKYLKEEKFCTLYAKYALEYITGLACSILKIEQLELTALKKKRVLSKLRNKLRYALIKNKRQIAMKENNLWIYALAYPRLMEMYWLSCVVKNKLANFFGKS